jgi:hypothetical protein
MAHRISIPRDRGANRRRFFAQKALVEKFFPCFQCHYVGGAHLECVGHITPSARSATYTLQIRYRYGGVPRVFVTSPDTFPSAIIHMYPDHSLCLYFPPEDPWKISDDVHRKIIPWVAEWVLLYELYLIENKWLGPEAPHGDDKKESQSDAARQQGADRRSL